ncbi:MAG: trypsin-like peptidase domain-containing protein [Lachnospiraceae bacterium]|nr:trypsin-like peptidase domain-containing protein [Lachnospiraceae bacterium]
MYEYYDHEDRQDPVVNVRPVREEKKEVKKEKKTKWFSCVAYALVFGLIAGGTIQGVSLAGDLVRGKLGLTADDIAGKENKAGANDDLSQRAKLKSADDETDEADEKDAKSKEKTKVTKEAEVTQLASTGTLDVSTVAKNAMPSIVAITNKSVQEVRSIFGSGIRAYESESAGSGIIIGKNDEELLLVTNNHVVEGAKQLSVCFIDDEVYEATVKGTDPDNDLAVIAVKLSDIKDSTMDKIAIAVMGDSDDLLIGQQVVAIGNALGYGQSVTTGIISALEREFKIDNYSAKLIQTDAAINPGNSGGALLNMKGEVVGINSAKLASSQIEGMGYAIPISTATPIIEDLMNRKTRDLVDKADASYLGVGGVSVSEQVSETYNIPEGVYISQVTEGGPADKAGIQKGDVIRKFDGVTVSSMVEIKEQLKYYKAGEKVKVTLKRADGSEYKDVTLTVTLGKKSESDLKDEDEMTDTDDEGQDNNFENGETYYIDPFSIFGY